MKFFDITYHFIDGKELSFEDVQADSQVNALEELESRAILNYASIYHKDKSYFIKEQNVTYIEVKEKASV